MTHPDEGALQALIDGELPPGLRAEAEAHLRRLVKLGRAEAVAGGEPVGYVAV